MSVDDIGQLREEVARLQRKIDELEQREAAPDQHVTTRRALLGGAVAAGGAALLGGQKVAAGTANGQSVDLGEVNVASETTEIRYDSPVAGEGEPNPRSHVFAVQDGAWGAQVPGASNTPETGTRSAIAGLTGNDVMHGVYGQSNTAVLGASGGRFRGESAFSYGLSTGGRRASLRLYVGESWARQTAPPDRLDFHNEGEITLDSDDDVWLCVASGNPGTWRKLGGPASAGAFHAIEPRRVYDSRQASIPQSGRFSPDTSRVVSVKDGRDPTSGTVTAADVVPARATAITYNVTVTETVGAGFVLVAPGDATTITGSTINWSSSGTTLANGSVVKLDDNRRVRVFVAAGSTHVIVDVTGYYL